MGGYCHECRHLVESKYIGSDWWCKYHDKPVDRHEYHECCE